MSNKQQQGISTPALSPVLPLVSPQKRKKGPLNQPTPPTTNKSTGASQPKEGREWPSRPTIFSSCSREKPALRWKAVPLALARQGEENQGVV